MIIKCPICGSETYTVFKDGGKKGRVCNVNCMQCSWGTFDLSEEEFRNKFQIIDEDQEMQERDRLRKGLKTLMKNWKEFATTFRDPYHNGNELFGVLEEEIRELEKKAKALRSLHEEFMDSCVHPNEYNGQAVRILKMMVRECEDGSEEFLQAGAVAMKALVNMGWKEKK